MKSLVFGGVLLASLCGAANAATITECASGSTCIPNTGMVDVFGNGTGPLTTNFGSLGVNDGSQNVKFVTNTAVNVSNGFAQVGTGNDSFTTLTISLNPVQAFHDLAFSVQSSNPQTIQITSSDGNDSTTFTNQGTEFYYTLQSVAALTSVTITGLAGTLLTKVANIQFSFSPVPIPGAALLLGTALGGFAGFGAFRRRRSSRNQLATA